MISEPKIIMLDPVEMSKMDFRDENSFFLGQIDLDHSRLFRLCRLDPDFATINDVGTIYVFVHPG